MFYILSRLSEREDFKVLLLEAGGSGSALLLSRVPAYALLLCPRGNERAEPPHKDVLHSLPFKARLESIHSAPKARNE